MANQQYDGIYINRDTQQIIIGSDSNLTSTLHIDTPSISRIYTISDVGKNASFLMNDSINGQTINNNLSLTGIISSGSVTTNLLDTNVIGTITGGVINSTTIINPILNGTLSGGYTQNVNLKGNTIIDKIYNGTITNCIISGGTILSNVTLESIGGGSITGQSLTVSNSTLTSNNYNIDILNNGSITNSIINAGTISSNVIILSSVPSITNVNNSQISYSTLSGNNYNLGTLYANTLSSATITSGYIDSSVVISNLQTEITNLETNIINTSYYYVLSDGSSINSQVYNTPRIYTSIQTAINDANTNGGGIVKLLNGVYTINSDLTLYSGVSLEGTYNSGSSYSTSMLGGSVITSNISGTMRTITLTNRTGETGEVYNISFANIRFISVGISLLSASNMRGLKITDCNFYQAGSGQFVNLNNTYYILEDIQIINNRFETSVASTMIYLTGKINPITSAQRMFLSENILVTPSISDNSAIQLTLTENGSADVFNRSITIDSNISTTSRFLTLLYVKGSTGAPVHMNTIISNNKVLSDDFGNGIRTATPFTTSNRHTIYFRDNFVNGNVFFNGNLSVGAYSSNQYGNYFFISNIVGVGNMSSSKNSYLALTDSLTTQNLGAGHYITENPGWNVISSNNATHTFTFQQIYEVGPRRIIQPLTNVTSLTLNPKIDIIPGTSNQLSFYTPTNCTSINISNPTSSVVHTISDIGQNANFIMSEGSQLINGEKVFPNITGSTITGSSISNCIFRSNTFDTLSNLHIGSYTLTGNQILTGTLSGGYPNVNSFGSLTGGYFNSTLTGVNTVSDNIINGSISSSLLNNNLNGSLTAYLLNSTLTNYNIVNGTISNGNILNPYVLGNASLTGNIIMNNDSNYLSLYNNVSSYRTYTLSDVGVDANFVMISGSQTSIGGVKTFTDNLIINNNIGIGTFSPLSPLHITPTLQTNDISTNGIYVYNPNNADNEYAIICARIAGSAGSSNANSAFVSFDVNSTNGWSMGIDNKDSQKFKIANSNNSLTSNTCMTINTSQKVGIGTINPTSTLHVNGTFQATSETITTSVITGDPIGTQSYSGNYALYQLSTSNSSYATGTNTLIWDNTNTYFSSGITHSNGVFNFTNTGIYLVSVFLYPSTAYASTQKISIQSSNDGVTFSSDVYYFNSIYTTTNFMAKAHFMLNVTSTTKYWRMMLTHDYSGNVGFTTGQLSRVMIYSFGSTSYGSFANSQASITAGSTTTITYNSTAEFKTSDITTASGTFTFTQSGLYLFIIQMTSVTAYTSFTNYNFRLSGSNNNSTYNYFTGSLKYLTVNSNESRNYGFFLVDTTVFKYWRVTIFLGSGANFVLTTDVASSRIMICNVSTNIYNSSRLTYFTNIVASSTLQLSHETVCCSLDKYIKVLNSTNSYIYFKKNGIYLVSIGYIATVSNFRIALQNSSNGSSWSSNVFQTYDYTNGATSDILFLIQVTDSTRYWRIMYDGGAAVTWNMSWYTYYSNQLNIFSVTTPVDTSTGGLYKNYYNSGEIVNITVFENLIKYMRYILPLSISFSAAGTNYNNLVSGYYTAGIKLMEVPFTVKLGAGYSNILVNVDSSYIISSTGLINSYLTIEYKNSASIDYKACEQSYRSNVAGGDCRSPLLFPFSAIFKNNAGIANNHTLTFYIGSSVAGISLNIDECFLNSLNMRITEVRI